MGCHKITPRGFKNPKLKGGSVVLYHSMGNNWMFHLEIYDVLDLANMSANRDLHCTLYCRCQVIERKIPFKTSTNLWSDNIVSHLELSSPECSQQLVALFTKRTHVLCFVKYTKKCWFLSFKPGKIVISCEFIITSIAQLYISWDDNYLVVNGGLGHN